LAIEQERIMKATANYYCVECKVRGCGFVPLAEFSDQLCLKLGELRPFKAVHSKCGLEFTYVAEELRREDLERVDSFVPHPDVVALLFPR
jgi:hypothetical protein